MPDRVDFNIAKVAWGPRDAPTTHGESVLIDLVGRQHELRHLRRQWDAARNGSGRVAVVVGEAGIGKSRVIDGFVGGIEPADRYYLRYQCSPHLTNSAFHPVVQRLSQAARLSANDSNEVRLDKLEYLLSELGDDPQTVTPLFASLLSIPAQDRYGPLELTPAQLRYRTIEALINQVLMMSEQKPVLFVLEDAHWIDPSMSDFIDELIPRVDDRAVCIVLAHRPENLPDWTAHDHSTAVALERIDHSHATSIVRAVGGEQLVSTMIEQIVVRAEGVPLYVEELTKSVLESIEQENSSANGIQIPASLQSSLVSRLDHLGPAKQIAQTAAVIGREFSHELLADIATPSARELNDALSRLVDSGLVLQRGTSPNVRYQFKHALVRDAAYSTIADSDRRDIHRRIVESVEQAGQQLTDEQVDVLAHHAVAAELWDKAFSYLQQSGQRAIDRAAIREAVAQFERALEVGQHLPETPESLRHAIDLRFDLRNALWSIGGFEQILTHLNDAEALAHRLADPARTGWIAVFRSASHWQLGRFEQALAAASAALEISKTADDISLWVGANFYLGCVYVTSGDCRKAEYYFAEIVNALTGDLRYDRCGLPFVPAVIARSWLVWALAERGDFEQGRMYADEALKIAEEVAHPFNLAHIYYDIGYFHEIEGDFDDAVDALGRAYDLIREWNLSYLSPFITGSSGTHVRCQGMSRTASSFYAVRWPNMHQSVSGCFDRW